MLSGRRRRISTSRKEDGKGWAHESDSDRPRPTMMASQRPNVDYPTDRHHRTSRRPDPSGNPSASSAAPKGPSPRDTDAGGPSYYTSAHSQNQAAYSQMATSGGASSSRARAPDVAPETNTMLAYLKRKTERRSPRSSDEKVHAGGASKASRQRTSVAPAAAIPASSSRPQPAPEMVMSSRDKERDREKRRQRELEKERLRAEEERYRAAAAALEAEKERQRRREEKELRRAEREKEKERERRKEEKEFERARRHREKEKLREKESRARDDGRAPLPGVVYPYQTAASSTRHHTEGRGSLDQVPSSSSNIALPPPQYASAYAASGRIRTTSDPRRDEIPSANTSNAPPLVPEKERKPHRSRRDKAPQQQHGGESGMSSSEQEHSGRERGTRTSDRRRPHRDYQTDPQQSGPSGSDTERASRDRRRASRVPNDPYSGNRHQSSGSVPLAPQPSATVGSASLPRYTPQIVSIRAGQGPADPDTPQMRAKAALNQARTRDAQAQLPASAQYQSYQSGSMPQGYTAPQGYVPAVATYRNEAPPDVQNPSYQPSTHALLHPSTTPRSTVIPMPPSNQAQRPSPASNHKVPLKPSPGRNEAVLNLSVYHPPGPAVSAELLLPHQYGSQTQTVTVNHTTVQDLAAKFPLHEDALTSASSSTLAPGTGRDATQRRGAQQGDGYHRYPDPEPYGRNAPPAEDLSTPYPGATYPTPSKQPHALYGENDVPIPIPGPRRNSMGAPADTRGQKSSSSSRPQAIPLQSKPSGTPAAQQYSSADYTYDPPYSASKYAAGTTTVSGQQQISNSPSRSVQHYLQRSPSTINAAPPAGGTPKHSPSIRLQTRNGSSDTVVYPVGKGSPHDASRSIRHSNSNTNLQTYVTSRPDTTTTRTTNPVSDYPDTGRRPSTSSYIPSSSQPAAYYSDRYPPHPSNYTHHSRTASQPTVPYPAFEYEPAPQRSQTQPVPLTPSANPAAAPSASAIVTAYRSGQYNTDQLQRVQPPSTQRVPPRSAPSPAPTLTQQQYAPAPSVMSKSGYPLPPNASQPARGQSYSAPSASRPSGPTHSRTASDPQFNASSTLAATSTRVAVAGHPSTPAPPKAQLMLHPTASEQELLMTPSSIAQSMLKGPHAPQPTARPPSIQGGKASSDKEGRKRGLLGLFRSRSSPPKPDARNPVASTSTPAPTKPRQRSSSQTTINAVAASVRNIIAPHPQPMRSSTTRPAAASGSPFGDGTAPSVRPPPTPAPEPEYDTVNASPRRRAVESIAAPRPVHAVSPEAHRSGRRSPNSKVFTPFRLISKKNRTVSAASVEALDGTAANTLIGGESARSSTAGRPSPPLRDTYTATQDWRNKEEEELQNRGTWRRRRPGVVFDVMDEFAEMETHHPARKQPRR